MKKLEDYFKYDPDTGIITRIKWDTKHGHDIAGNVSKDGYRYVSFYNGKIKAHRLAWYLYYGEMPKYDIDHINHNKDDNRIKNLRDVPTNINCQNSFLSSNNKTGHYGIKWHQRLNKWEAQIGGKNCRKYLGVFEKFEDAVKARETAERELGYHPNHGKRVVAI